MCVEGLTGISSVILDETMCPFFTSACSADVDVDYWMDGELHSAPKVEEVLDYGGMFGSIPISLFDFILMVLKIAT